MTPLTDDRFHEIEDTILKERDRGLAHIRRTRLGDRLHARLDSHIDSGIAVASWRIFLLAFLGIALITVAVSLIWFSTRNSKTGKIPRYDAFIDTLSLVIEPSQPPAMDSRPDLDRIRAEQNENPIGRVFSQLIQASDEESVHTFSGRLLDGAPFFSPREIDQILIRDRVIEKALILIIMEKQGGVT